MNQATALKVIEKRTGKLAVDPKDNENVPPARSTPWK